MNIRFGCKAIFIIACTVLLLQTSYPAIAQNAPKMIGGSLNYPDKNNNLIHFEVPPGKEIEILKDLAWSTEPVFSETPSETPIDSHDAMLPLRGGWNWNGEQLQQLSVGFKTTSLIFKPIVDSGQIKMDARFFDGDEGVKIIFGFTSPDNFYEIRIGGFSHNAITIMHTNGLNPEAKSSVLAKMNYNMINNQWYNIQVSIDHIQGMVCCVVNDRNIECKANLPISGRFGVGTSYSDAHFKNIFISQSPQASLKSDNKPSDYSAQKPKKTFSYIKQLFKDTGFDAQWDETTNRGFLVNAVTWNSPASKAGMHSGDLIVSINDAEFGIDVESNDNRENAAHDIYGLGKLPWQMTIERAGTGESIGLILHPRKNVANPKTPNVRQSPYNIQIKRRPLVVYGSSPQGVSKIHLKDDTLLTEKKWSDVPVEGIITIDESSENLAFRGNWEIKGATFHQTDDDITPTALIFEPVIDPVGEIRLKARAIKGSEGIRIVFAYKSANQYLVWNIGGWENKKMVVEKWFGHDRFNRHADLTVWKDLIFEHNKWHDIRLVIDIEKSMVKGFVNGKRELLLSTNEPLYGRVGVGTWNTEVEYKDIVIIGGRDNVK